MASTLSLRKNSELITALQDSKVGNEEFTLFKKSMTDGLALKLDSTQLNAFKDELNANRKVIMSGESNFASTIGVSIPHAVGSTAYTVIVTPSSNAAGYLGEYWVEYAANNFVVKCSGTATTKFKYIVVV